MPDRTAVQTPIDSDVPLPGAGSLSNNSFIDHASQDRKGIIGQNVCHRIVSTFMDGGLLGLDHQPILFESQGDSIGEFPREGRIGNVEVVRISPKEMRIALVLGGDNLGGAKLHSFGYAATFGRTGSSRCAARIHCKDVPSDIEFVNVPAIDRTVEAIEALKIRRDFWFA